MVISIKVYCSKKQKQQQKRLKADCELSILKTEAEE